MYVGMSLYVCMYVYINVGTPLYIYLLRMSLETYLLDEAGICFLALLGVVGGDLVEGQDQSRIDILVLDDAGRVGLPPTSSSCCLLLLDG